MFCTNDKDDLLRTLFEESKSYKLEGNKLELQNKSGKNILTFDLISQ
jgi:hypothetical protein